MLEYPGIEQIKPSIYKFKSAIQEQPVLVTFRVHEMAFFQYQRGILPERACGGSLNHSMVAVGYGHTREDQLFVIVQNSWGEDWGEQGYLRVQLTDEDRCGLMAQAFKILV